MESTCQCWNNVCRTVNESNILQRRNWSFWGSVVTLVRVPTVYFLQEKEKPFVYFRFLSIESRSYKVKVKKCLTILHIILELIILDIIKMKQSINTNDGSHLLNYENQTDKHPICPHQPAGFF